MTLNKKTEHQVIPVDGRDEAVCRRTAAALEKIVGGKRVQAYVGNLFNGGLKIEFWILCCNGVQRADIGMLEGVEKVLEASEVRGFVVLFFVSFFPGGVGGLMS